MLGWIFCLKKKGYTLIYNQYYYVNKTILDYLLCIKTYVDIM